MGLKCSINYSVLPTTWAYVYVIRGVWYESTETPFKPIHLRVRRKRQRLASNATIESDAAAEPPLAGQRCLAASLPIEF